MSFKEYRDWQPGDDDLPDERELIRQQEAKIAKLREDLIAVAQVVGTLVHQNTYLKDTLDAHGKIFSAVQEVMEMQQNQISALLMMHRCLISGRQP